MAGRGLGWMNSTPNIFFLLQDLEEGSISQLQLLDEDNQAYWAIIKLDERFPAAPIPETTTACFNSMAELREEASKWIGQRIGVCPGRFALQGVHLGHAVADELLCLRRGSS